jgi:uncharacterized protein involved in type VI secretion and phage assembly
MFRTSSSGGATDQRLIAPVLNAIVVDNVDPLGQGRVKVSFPHLSGDPESTWLRMCTPVGGDKFGFYALPEVGEEVLIAFLRGSPEDGIVLGSLWSSSNMPPEEAATPPAPDEATVGGASISTDTYTAGSTTIDRNDRRLWRSRSGHLLMFDDTEGAESVQLWDKTRSLAIVLDSASNRIVVSNGAGDLHLRARGKVVLEAGQEVLVQAGTDFKEESTGVTELKAGTTGQFQATAGLTLKSDADVDIQGLNITAAANVKFEASGVMCKVAGSAQVELTGGASATIRGGVVMIN